MNGIDELRRMTRMYSGNEEGFNQRFTLAELIKIWRAYLATGWEFYPDQWTERQVQDALKGLVPRWDADERPITSGKLKRVTSNHRERRR